MPARPARLLLLLLSLALAPLASARADGGGRMAAKAPLSTARKQVSARQWPGAWQSCAGWTSVAAPTGTT